LLLWSDYCNSVYRGEEISEIFADQDVIKLYQDVFYNISGVYRLFQFEYLDSQDWSCPSKDNHPTPYEALMFLDHVWPGNTISDEARNYATSWDYSRSVVRPLVYRL
jgi:hypothetical protein